MTRLFVRFYLGVLAVLLAAWYLQGEISDLQFDREVPEVAESAHQGGVRQIVARLNELPPQQRRARLHEMRPLFDFQIYIQKIEKLPGDARARLTGGNDIVFFQRQLAARLEGDEEVVRMGPFPFGTEHELSFGGGVRLAARRFDSAPQADREKVLAEMTDEFGYRLELISKDELKEWEQRRLFEFHHDVVLYGTEEGGFFLAPVLGGTQVLRFGPLPNFEATEQRVLGKTTAAALIIAALAIAVLLRPVVQQLRRVEFAVRAISKGDLTARVDESKTRSAAQLAEAFNSMANQTETLLRTQRELLQAVSHELRTPLSRIRFAIDLIESAKDDEERKQRLQSLDDAAGELNELVGELLNYVRLENAEPDQPREPIALSENIPALIEKHAALHPNIEFSVNGLASRQNGTVVEANPVALHRAIGNLLSNAGRFAKSRVSVSAHSEGNQVAISVDDDGPGIPEADRTRVFDPFTRLEEAPNGVGLGLSIVRRIVTQHGGDIRVEQSPEGGCRMTTVWPGGDTPPAEEN